MMTRPTHQLPQNAGILKRKLGVSAGEAMPEPELTMPTAGNALALPKELVFGKASKAWGRKR